VASGVGELMAGVGLGESVGLGDTTAAGIEGAIAAGAGVGAGREGVGSTGGTAVLAGRTTIGS